MAFQNNAIVGLIFLIGVASNSVPSALALLLGTVIGTLVALAFKGEASHRLDGLYGFNGGLVTLALVYFLGSSAVVWLLAAFGAAFSSLVMFSLLRLFQRWRFPTLTAPFVFTTLVFLLVYRPQLSAPLIDGKLIAGLFNGLAQIFFQDNPVTGAIIAAGLFLGSRRAFSMGLLGSATGLIFAWAYGESLVAIHSGVFGFNCALTAIALGGLLKESSASLFYIVLATFITAVAFTAMASLFQPLGLPVLTLPFVAVVWLFVILGRTHLASRLFR